MREFLPIGRKILVLVFCLGLYTTSLAQLTAGFKASVVSGCAPLIVSFTDQSTGTPTSWKWDLGNGAQSTLQNPSATYFNPGTYNIKLVVRNAAGADSIIKSAFITVHSNPVVFFTQGDSTGCAPFTVNFTDRSTAAGGTISNWRWDFGDGTLGSDQNPSHLYTTPGIYSVTLQATTNNGCTKSFTKDQVIKATFGVNAAFDHSTPAACSIPVAVNFNNLSTGPDSLSYQWDFGDGTTSTAANPSHNYSAAGKYTVRLIVTSKQGCTDTLVKSNLVTVGTAPSFTTESTICAGKPVAFTNTSSPSPLSVKWNFGDNTTSTLFSPVHIYTTPGVYTITLINQYGAGCMDSIKNTITVLPKPVAGFTGTNLTACSGPLTVSFTNSSVGAATYSWLFGDGGTSTNANPTHTYNAAGNYTVTLIATSASGCTDTIVKNAFVKIEPPVISLRNLPATGCLPIRINPVATITSNESITGYLWDFGDGATSASVNPTHTYTVAGTYNVSLTITTASGCKTTYTFPSAVRAGNKPNAGFMVIPPVQCAKDAVQFTDTSSGKVDEWLWFFGDGTTSAAQNPFHTYSDLGYFNVTLIVSSNTCKDTIRIDSAVFIKPPIAVFDVVNNCTDKYTKKFTNRSYSDITSTLWEFGDGTTSTEVSPSHTYAATGNYTVKLTVWSATCFNETTRYVQVIDEKAAFVPSDKIVCKGVDIIFNAPAINTANISKWEWNFGDGFTSAAAGMARYAYAAPGKYKVTLTITDLHGCINDFSDSITVYGPTASFTASSLTSCLETSTINFADGSTTDGIHPLVNWSWNYGDGNTASLAGGPFAHTYKNTGVFQVKLTVTDSYGCRDSINVPGGITISKPEAIFYSPDTIACTKNNISFVNVSNGSSLTATWKFGDGQTSNVYQPSHIYAASGTYSINLVVKDQYGCTDTLDRDAYINVSTPQAKFAMSDSIGDCPPFLVNFTNGSTDYKTYNWDFGDGNTSVLKDPSHHYTLAGTYYPKLLVQGVGGCIDTISKKVIVKGPQGTFTYGPGSGCLPVTMNLNANVLNTVNMVWDMGDGTVLTGMQLTPSHIYTTAGEYVPRMIIYDARGCVVPIIGKDTIRVATINADMLLTGQSFCDSGSYTMRDQSVSNDFITGWKWNFGDGATSSLQNPAHEYKTPGLYKASLVVTTQLGCKDTVETSITIFESPVVDIMGDITACAFAPLQVYGKVNRGDSASLAWDWQFSNGNTSSVIAPPTQLFNVAGDYTVKAIVTDKNNCTDTIEKTISINPLPVTSAGSDVMLCEGSTLTLNATGATSYEWKTAATLSCTTCPDPVSSTRDTVQYFVTGYNEFGCSASDSIKVNVRKKINVTASNSDSLCAGSTVKLWAAGADRYNWSPSAGLDNTNTASVNANPLVTTTYTVVATDNEGCFSDTLRIPVKVNPMPEINAGQDLTLAVGSSVKLLTTSSPDIVSWKWSPALGLSCNNCPQPVANPKQTMTYKVEVTTAGKCISRDEVVIQVVCNNGNLFVPNTFSPNGDGNNDIFYPRGSGINNIKSFRVFNRWGEVVFEKLNFQANQPQHGWDGSFKGNKATPDVYVYTVDVMCDNGTIIPFKGNIALIQ